MVTHHILPKSKGGTDEYENIIIINDRVHEIIHYVKTLEEATEMMKIEFALDKRKMKKFIEIYNKAR